MTPTPKRQAVIVGLFVAFATAVLAGGILTIGGINDSFGSKITVNARFDEVSGLKAGDNVWFSGVKVGTVRSLEFHGTRQVQVEMSIDEDALPYLHDDALAKISSEGMIGSRIVVLYGGTPEAGLLEDGDLVATGTSVSTEDLMAKLQENNTNILVITTKLANGEGTLGKLLHGDTLYTKVTDTVTALNTASTNAGEMTASLSTFAEKLNRPGRLPNDIVTDTTTYASIVDTVGKVNHAGERTSSMMDGLATAVANPDTVIGTLMHDEPAGTDLKVTFDNMSTTSALLKEDAEALQHNILVRGYFKKKARAEAKAADETAKDAPANPKN